MEIAPMEELGRSPVQILLVEDEFFIRIDVAAALREAGFQVVEAVSADEAWAFLESRQLPDLLLTDVQTPGDLNGLMLARRVRERFPHLPVIINSGDPTTQKAAARLGKFVGKPYEIADIVRMVTDIAGQPPNKI